MECAREVCLHINNLLSAVVYNNLGKCPHGLLFAAFSGLVLDLSDLTNHGENINGLYPFLSSVRNRIK